MRKLVVTENITVDGVMDAFGEWFHPADDNADVSDLVEATREHAAAADDSRTFRSGVVLLTYAVAA